MDALTPTSPQKDARNPHRAASVATDRERPDRPPPLTAPEPALEPPGERSRFQGLRVASNTALWLAPL